MHNLFIVNTPFQLLTAYIIANYYHLGERNQLLVVRPSGYGLWNNSACLQSILADRVVWQQSDFLLRWLDRHVRITEMHDQVREIREKMRHGGPADRVYLCSDKIIQNQLLVELAGCNNYIRFDEGLGSYWCRDRHPLSKLYQKMRIKVLRKMLGIQGNLAYNLGGIGWGSAATADFLYKPDIIKRPSVNPVAIPKQAVQQAIRKITIDKNLLPDDTHQAVMFVGSCFVELKWLDHRQEIKLISNIVQIAAKKGFQVIYKTHPSENRAKIAFYQKLFPNMKVFYSVEPIEVIYGLMKNLRIVISYASSGLMYADIFSDKSIAAINLINLAGREPDNHARIWDQILQEAGVISLHSFEKLEDYLK